MLISSLIKRVKNNSINEVILATSATIEGQTTAHYIQNSLKGVDVKISDFAGSAYIRAYAGDGEAATSASLNRPAALRFDSNNNAYIADMYNHRIRKVDGNGIITTFVFGPLIFLNPIIY